MMFERITAPRPNARHTKSALALAMLLNFGGVGSMLGIGDVQRIIEELEEAPMIEVILAPSPAPAAPPAAAFSPPSAPKEAIKPPKERVIEEPPVEPTEPTESIEPIEPTSPAFANDAIAALDAPASPGGCPPGQICDGPPEAIGSGCPPGEICSSDSSAILYLTSADVRPRRRVAPKFPAAARSLNIDEAHCHVRFTINEKGNPTDITINNCPRIFHEETLKAAWQWKFYPIRNDQGVKSAAAFVLKLSFVLN